jgi:hypothetical protein
MEGHRVLCSQCQEEGAAATQTCRQVSSGPLGRPPRPAGQRRNTACPPRPMLTWHRPSCGRPASRTESAGRFGSGCHLSRQCCVALKCVFFIYLKKILFSPCKWRMLGPRYGRGGGGGVDVAAAGRYESRKSESTMFWECIKNRSTNLETNIRQGLRRGEDEVSPSTW